MNTLRYALQALDLRSVLVLSSEDPMVRALAKDVLLNRGAERRGDQPRIVLETPRQAWLELQKRWR